MKKSTCKILLWIGVVWIVFITLSTVLGVSFIRKEYGDLGMPFSLWVVNIFVLIIPAIILIIIAIAKWNSEEEHKEVKEAQLQALKKGKVNVDLKGKMRKLK